ncbi:tannase and feruloyl esterase [Colletotrichum plurivorum]|uniref:Carboxylic ester hydrolase n=1 Tax=Colletotrichum plurivorum TaxID=2175906 RepID=A0A8H6N8W4_9PEZI|nr:tannase and feruloyl esterase [Colletotrichum plurivorum]
MVLTLAQACAAEAFNLALPGAEIISLAANLVTNFTASAEDIYRYISPTVEATDVSFCNITVTYTHPGQNDKIITEAWLPLEWNERFMAVGGGGYAAGRFFLSYAGMNGAVAEGYATITTDAGLGSAQEPSPWALNSPGNVNLYNLQNVGSVSLNDGAIIGKSLIKSFYGTGPKYSYWNGCSQGGRQGLMLAQRYPKAYDGIAAGAPAINWNSLLSYVQWPQQVMNELGKYPYACELDAITAAAIAACDGLDGVVDGAIADIPECLKRFNASSVIGQTISCAQLNGTQRTISETAAAVVEATWSGMVTAEGDKVYPGVNPGSDLSSGIVRTNCTAEGCAGAPALLGTAWLQLFVAKTPGFDMSELTRPEFDAMVYSGRQQFVSLVETADPDLRAFRDAGGKLVTFHGLADGIIPTAATEEYYKAVAGVSPDVRDFYRYFEVPALNHCFHGASGQPRDLFRQLRDWVENGTAPERTPVKLKVGEGEIHDRILCPYPQKPELCPLCGDASLAECWSCSDLESPKASGTIWSPAQVPLRV